MSYETFQSEEIIPDEGVDCKGREYKRVYKWRGKDITGQVFERYTALFPVRDKNNTLKWLFKCQCGSLNMINRQTVESGKSKGCGCSRNLIGKSFGRLMVIERVENNKFGQLMWKCICSCGNEKIIRGYALIQGRTTSCGCIHSEGLVNKNIKDREQLEGKVFGGIEVISFIEYRFTSHLGTKREGWYRCKCIYCGKEIEMSRDSIRRRKNSCGCQILSSGEEKIKTKLEENNIIYQREYRIPECKNVFPLPFDFAIFNENEELIRLVEYDGEQHFHPITLYGGEEEFKKRQFRDKIKNEYCLSHNIPLVRIPYTIKDITIEMILNDEFLI